MLQLAAPALISTAARAGAEDAQPATGAQPGSLPRCGSTGVRLVLDRSIALYRGQRPERRPSVPLMSQWIRCRESFPSKKNRTGAIGSRERRRGHRLQSVLSTPSAASTDHRVSGSQSSSNRQCLRQPGTQITFRSSLRNSLASATALSSRPPSIARSMIRTTSSPTSAGSPARVTPP